MLAQLEPYGRKDFALENNFAGHRKTSKRATIHLLGFGNWTCYTPFHVRNEKGARLRPSTWTIVRSAKGVGI